MCEDAIKSHYRHCNNGPGNVARRRDKDSPKMGTKELRGQFCKQQFMNTFGSIGFRSI